MALNTSLKDYTIVVTENQTQGRGQMEGYWDSEPYKNLTFSLFTTLEKLEIKHQAYLNFAVCLAIYDALKSLCIPDLFVKWPNDIMADSKKVCGVLIETTFKKNKIKNTIIGIGLNVNQEKFSNKLPKAISLSQLLNTSFDLDTLLKQIVEQIKKYIQKLENQEFDFIHTSYLNALYKIGISSYFINTKNNQLFKGKIVDVNPNGKLVVQLEDKTHIDFENKEVKFATI